MSTTIPVTLVTGLLGSGKSTLIQQLIQQKPVNETWAILVNEFGEVDIDSFILQSQPKAKLLIEAVSGGCICCTAQFSLVQAVNKLLQQNSRIDRLIVEPTGLGHPANVIDTLSQSQFHTELKIQQILCLVTAMQLTPERWQKSKVMRDLVTLADTLIINKIDLANQAELKQAQAIIANLYPAKNGVISTQYAKIDMTEAFKRPQTTSTFITILDPVKNQSTSKPTSNATNSSKLRLYPNQAFLNTKNRVPHFTHQQQAFKSTIKSAETCFVQFTPTPELDDRALNSIGWTWPVSTQFNRTKLKAFFEQPQLNINRAKGIIKTGKEWQLLQWADNQLSLSDIAWRQDSRLELFFYAKAPEISTHLIEQHLLKTIHQH